jgi:hypothetical protein
MSALQWLVFVHLAGAFAFVLGHGASAMVSFRLRDERDPARIRALLDLSSSSIGVLYGGILLVLVGGIAAGFVGSSWGHGWIWLSLGLLVAITVAMYPIGSLFYARVRNAVGMKSYRDPKDAPPPEPASPAELDALLSSSRPWVLALIGGGGLLVILFLMLAKPF